MSGRDAGVYSADRPGQGHVGTVGQKVGAHVVSIGIRTRIGYFGSLDTQHGVGNRGASFERNASQGSNEAVCEGKVCMWGLRTEECALYPLKIEL